MKLLPIRRGEITRTQVGFSVVPVIRRINNVSSRAGSRARTKTAACGAANRGFESHPARCKSGSNPFYFGFGHTIPRSEIEMTKGVTTSEYDYLFEDQNFKRWFDNVTRGSIVTATVWLR